MRTILLLWFLVIGMTGCKAVVKSLPGWSTERGWHAGPWQSKPAVTEEK